MRMMDTRKSFQRLRSMQCNLHEVFTQASKDHSSCRYETSDYDSYLSHGIKIVKDNRTQRVTIMDTTMSEYYEEISDEHYNLFRTKGWLFGIYTLSLTNFKQRIDQLNEGIRYEVNQNKRKKKLLQLREEREQVLKRYYKVNQLLIKLNNNE